MGPEVLVDAFTAAVEEHPQNLAVVDDAASRTYAELRQDVERLARGLVAAGLRHGDRFAIQLPNGIPWVTAFWGAAMAGCVVVPLNTRNRPAEIAYMLQQCAASAVLATDDADVPETGARVLRLGALDDLLAGGESVDPQQLAERRVATDADEVCLIQFTSGSTGYPKGAMLTHAGVLTDGHALRQAWRLEAGEALVVPSPLSHVLGLMAGCVVPALAGAALLTMANFDPARTLELIDRYRAVGTTGTPTHYLMLVEHPDRPRRDISSLRFAMYGGAPFTPEAARRVVADLGSTTLLGGFGMSETAGGVTSVSLDDPPEIQLTTVGRPLPPFEVKVVDPETGEEQAPGEVGELWVRGRPVLKGY